MLKLDCLKLLPSMWTQAVLGNFTSCIVIKSFMVRLVCLTRGYNSSLNCLAFSAKNELGLETVEQMWN